MKASSDRAKEDCFTQKIATLNQRLGLSQLMLNPPFKHQGEGDLYDNIVCNHVIKKKTPKPIIVVTTILMTKVIMAWDNFIALNDLPFVK